MMDKSSDDEAERMDAALEQIKAIHRAGHLAREKKFAEAVLILDDAGIPVRPSRPYLFTAQDKKEIEAGLVLLEPSTPIAEKASPIRKLSIHETIEFVKKRIYMGPPKAVKLNNDGTPRKNSKNQYYLANKRRKGHFHRLVRLPEAGRQALAPYYEKHLVRIGEIAKTLAATVPPHKLTTAVMHAMEKARLYRDRKNVSKALKRLGYL